MRFRAAQADSRYWGTCLSRIEKQAIGNCGVLDKKGLVGLRRCATLVVPTKELTDEGLACLTGKPVCGSRQLGGARLCVRCVS